MAHIERIELKRVSRIFGRSYALHEVNAHFDSGTLTAVLGDNGAGKTTLLNILATLDQPDAGQVLYDSWSWKRFARQGRRFLGWVGHETLLYDDLTGRENLQFYGAMYKLPRLKHVIDEWLDKVGLSEAADRRVQTYSRGMRQRLTIARALLPNPALLILDEPLTGLDQRARKQFQELFAQICDQQKTVILTSHDLSMVEGVADQAVILQRGMVTYFGDARVPEGVFGLYKQFA